MIVICEIKQKNTLSFSGNAVVRDAFLLHRFFNLSLTHAPIFHRSMRMLWMQLNISCFAAATFKMIAMSSARSASVLSAVKPKQTTVSAAALIPPHANFDHASNPALCKPTPLDSADVWTTLMSAYKASSVKNPQGRIFWYTNTANLKILCLLHEFRRKLLCLLRYDIGEPIYYTL